MSLVLTIVNAWRPSFSRLQETADFGSNPGALRMLTFLRIIYRQGLLSLSFFMAQCSRQPITTVVLVGRRLQTNMVSRC